MSVATDVTAERAVLAGICRYGSQAFYDIADFVQVSSFTVRTNQIIFSCLKEICTKNEDVVEVDLPTILSTAKQLSLDSYLQRAEEHRHLNSILSLPIAETNIRRFAGKLRRLEVARLLFERGTTLQEKMSEMDGSETISQMLGVAENVIFDFTSMINNEGELQAKAIGDNIKDYVQYLGENQSDVIGISTGYDYFDAAIGGGLLPGVTVIGSRAKIGKTTLSVNITKNVGEQDIPVLYLDTEMVETGKYRDISIKMLSLVSGIDMKDIKNGSFANDPIMKERVEDAADWIEKHPNMKRIGISGVDFEDQIYAMRKWVQSEVGFNPDGTAKDCVIIYDYLKLMGADQVEESMREFQLLGIMMTSLQNFAVRYAIPILAYTQLNRDGLDGEHAGVVAGSDRITWFCTAFCIFKPKGAEEIAQDGEHRGNRKLIVLLSRYGPGHDFGEYISFNMNKYRALIEEVHDDVENFGDFMMVDNNDDDIPFE